MHPGGHLLAGAQAQDDGEQGLQTLFISSKTSNSSSRSPEPKRQGFGSPTGREWKPWSVGKTSPTINLTTASRSSAPRSLILCRTSGALSTCCPLAADGQVPRADPSALPPAHRGVPAQGLPCPSCPSKASASRLGCWAPPACGSRPTPSPTVTQKTWTTGGAPLPGSTSPAGICRLPPLLAALPPLLAQAPGSGPHRGDSQWGHVYAGLIQWRNVAELPPDGESLTDCHLLHPSHWLSSPLAHLGAVMGRGQGAFVMKWLTFATNWKKN